MVRVLAWRNWEVWIWFLVLSLIFFSFNLGKSLVCIILSVLLGVLFSSIYHLASLPNPEMSCVEEAGAGALEHTGDSHLEGALVAALNSASSHHF